MNREELIQFLKDNLSLEIQEDESYNGGMDGGDMYTKFHKVRLKLGDEVISEEYLD